jgi:hypothetical protein
MDPVRVAGVDLFGKEDESFKVFPGLDFLDFEGHGSCLSQAALSFSYLPGFQWKNQIFFYSGNPVQKMRTTCGNS